MYRPSAFAEDDPAWLGDFLRRQSFGLLVSAGPDGPAASPVPFLHAAAAGSAGEGGGAGGGHLLCHLARANPHWRALEAAGPAAPVLAVFSGPHAYISPAWYASAPAVPTWNYVTVQVAGRARVVHDAAAKRAIVDGLTRQHEAGRAQPWSLDSVPEAFLLRQLEGIVGIEIAIDRIEGKRKLSQNRSAADRAGVIMALRAAGDADSLAVAAEMAGGPP